MDVNSFLKEKFRGYYRNNPVKGPPLIEKREFGIGDFGRKITQRHLSFASAKYLNDFLASEAPMYISYSNAYYKYPAKRPMEAKELERADLVYEFDADDLKTDCKDKHDSWKCKCGATGKGSVENCSECGSAVEVEQWVCSECLDAVKKEIFRLLDFLNRDFGLSENIEINFSGSKGFHIHVRDRAIQHLSNSARIELVDYLTANEINPARLGFYYDKQNRFHCPKPSLAVGWSKKIIDGILELLKENDSERLAIAGSIPNSLAQQLLNERNRIINTIDTGVLYQLPGRKTEKFWNSVILYVVNELGLKIDRQTSVDISKIVRVPDTLHGGTGLVAKSFPLEKLKQFEPLNDTIAFSNKMVKVKIEKAPKLLLGNKRWGPYNNEERELPEYVAIYLLVRGSADAVGL